MKWDNQDCGAPVQLLPRRFAVPLRYETPDRASGEQFCRESTLECLCHKCRT